MTVPQESKEMFTKIIMEFAGSIDPYACRDLLDETFQGWLASPQIDGSLSTDRMAIYFCLQDVKKLMDEIESAVESVRRFNKA